MRVLFWFCDRFEWTPSMQTIDDAPPAEPAQFAKAVVAFVHVEPNDTATGSSAETKLVKNAKWLARKWEVSTVVLHSFTHLGEEKADPTDAHALLLRARERLRSSGYQPVLTPYGYFNDLVIDAPGHPLARIYKAF
jgi:hypothetical protein